MLDIPRHARQHRRPRPARDQRGLQDGPQAAADAVGALVGVSISYVISVRFHEFPLIDDIGGSRSMSTCTWPTRTPARSSSPVRNDMNGTQALAFSRARHLGRGDFTRTEHQGQLILAVLAKVSAQGTSTVDTMKYLGVMMRYTRPDGISTADLLRLGRLALSIDPTNVRNVVMPGQGATIAGISYVVTSPDAPGCSPISLTTRCCNHTDKHRGVRESSKSRCIAGRQTIVGHTIVGVDTPDAGSSSWAHAERPATCAEEAHDHGGATSRKAADARHGRTGARRFGMTAVACRRRPCRGHRHGVRVRARSSRVGSPAPASRWSAHVADQRSADWAVSNSIRRSRARCRCVRSHHR